MTSSRSTTAVITDSTSDLPAELAVKHGVGVVPLQVLLEGRSYAEGVDIQPEAVTAALRAGQVVTTSQPPPAAFTAAYRRAAEDGAAAVVSLHLSAQLSGTVTAARLGAAAVPDLDVRVVDSGTVAMGLGFAALAAAEAAAAGEPAEEVERLALAAAGRSAVLIYVDTLEYLRRGGRIGAAASLVGAALAVKPLLHIAGGQVAPLAKVRTAAKARARLLDLAVQAAGAAPVDVAVQHLGAPGLAEEAAQALRERVPDLRTLHITPVGAVVGAHVGPGSILLVVAPS